MSDNELRGRARARTPSRLIWVLILLPLVLVSGGLVALTISEQRYEALAAAGTPTLAQVKRMDSAHCFSRGDNRCLRLALQLHPENRESYAAELTRDIAVNWLSRVQPGSWLTVSVDPNDPSKVYFDERSMAVAPPAPAAPRTGDSPTPP